jgi:hypothetical protein
VPKEKEDKRRVQGSGFKVQGSRFRVQGSRFKVQGSRFKVQGSVSNEMHLLIDNDSKQ